MARKHVGVIGHEYLRREEHSSGIINIDNDALSRYKAERDQKLKLQKMFSEHEDMKTDIVDIKSMLAELLERNK